MEHGWQQSSLHMLHCNCFYGKQEEVHQLVQKEMTNKQHLSPALHFGGEWWIIIWPSWWLQNDQQLMYKDKGWRPSPLLILEYITENLIITMADSVLAISPILQMANKFWAMGPCWTWRWLTSIHNNGQVSGNSDDN